MANRITIRDYSPIVKFHDNTHVKNYARFSFYSTDINRWSKSIQTVQ